MRLVKPEVTAAKESMRYRIERLMHECAAQKEGQPTVYWDRGKWIVDSHCVEKCPYCKKKFPDPSQYNWVSTTPLKYFVEALQATREYAGVFIEHVDKRKKEYRNGK